jgi:two-component system response regulator GlrR
MSLLEQDGFGASHVGGTSDHVSLPGIIGISEAFKEMMRRIAKIAPTDVSVLIEGETGVGKELAARALHYSSPRKSKPFIALNCGAIPESLIESELFGFVRGAFTDAKTAHPGVVGQAHGGTLFLDEIDSLAPKGQVAMLRFLQDRRYRPLGQGAERVSDGRVIAATNRPLAELVDRGAFRSDLMYRLNVIRLEVPPLRERRVDIVPLTEHFLQLFPRRYGKAVRPLHPDCWQWMLSYSWPGNIRELESTLHRAVLLAEGDEIFPEEVAQAIVLASAPPPIKPRCAGHPGFQNAKALAIADFERRYVSELLEQTDGNISKAARLAKKERRSFGKLVKKHGIVRSES